MFLRSSQTNTSVGYEIGRQPKEAVCCQLFPGEWPPQPSFLLPNRLCVTTTFSFPWHSRDEMKKKYVSRCIVNPGSDFTLRKTSKWPGAICCVLIVVFPSRLLVTQLAGALWWEEVSHATSRLWTPVDLPLLRGWRYNWSSPYSLSRLSGFFREHLLTLIFFPFNFYIF